MNEFNPYINSIDLTYLKDICISKGRLVSYKRNEYFSRAGEVASSVGYVLDGALRYTCFNHSERRGVNTGFVFTREFVADYPACLYGIPSEIDIQAVTPCKVYVCPGEELNLYFERDAENQRKARINAEQLFLMVYSRLLDTYRKTPEERYRDLLHRCPEILQVLTLKELSSYLKITPITMSKIRRKITFSE